MLERLREQGYKGNGTMLSAFVHPLRPRNVGHPPVMRYETKPGEQMQYEWGEFQYEQKGHDRKLYGFTAILGYSRMRFVTFVKRCDTPTMSSSHDGSVRVLWRVTQSCAHRSHEKRLSGDGR